MKAFSKRFSIHQQADLAVLVLLATFIAIYSYHVWSLSSELLNVVLVVPVSLLALLLCGFEFIRQLKVADPDAPSDEVESVRSVIPVMILFSLYVIAIPWLGFDVGSAIFVAVFLWVHGEKRWYWALSYGLVLGFVVAIIFSNLLPYPMPMLILPTAY